MRSKYGDGRPVIEHYSPKNLIDITNDRRNCFLGDNPTFAQLNVAYGRQFTEAWVMLHMKDFCMQANIRNEWTTSQMERMAGIIASDYHYIKITEFMYFIRLCEAGRYGQYYGNMQTLKFMEDFRNFVFHFRFSAIDELKNQ